MDENMLESRDADYGAGLRDIFNYPTITRPGNSRVMVYIFGTSHSILTCKLPEGSPNDSASVQPKFKKIE